MLSNHIQPPVSDSIQTMGYLCLLHTLRRARILICTIGSTIYAIIQYPIVGDIIMNVGLVVRGSLDPDKLKNGLAALILNHWPKLGARVKGKRSGRYGAPCPRRLLTRATTIHIQYQACRRIFAERCSPETHCEALDTSRVQERSAPFPHTGNTVNDTRIPDRPIIALHVTTFADVTLIGFTIPHCFTDMLGVGIILQAWCAVLAGRAPPPFFEENDVLGPFEARYPKTEAGVIELRERKLTTMPLPSPEEEIIPPAAKEEEEERMLFLPSKVIDKHRAEGLRELRAKGLEDVWFSEHDVLTAMLMKLNLSQHSSTPDVSPHVMGFASNLRGRIAILPASSPVYLHNGATSTHTFR